jgi:hypothetical protein
MIIGALAMFEGMVKSLFRLITISRPSTLRLNLPPRIAFMARFSSSLRMRKV